MVSNLNSKLSELSNDERRDNQPRSFQRRTNCFRRDYMNFVRVLKNGLVLPVKVDQIVPLAISILRQLKG